MNLNTTLKDPKAIPGAKKYKATKIDQARSAKQQHRKNTHEHDAFAPTA